MKKLLDLIYIVFFGKYTLKGFAKKKDLPKYKYVFDSVFPDEEIMNIALSSSQHSSSIITK